MKNSVLIILILLNFGQCWESCDETSEDSYEIRENRKKCPKNWREFERGSGRWCIRVFAGILNKFEAEARCENYGGVLSGIENLEEQSFINSEGVKILQDQGLPSGSLWINLIRKPECRNENDAKLARCNGSLGFQWYDKSTFNTNMMTWSSWNPDNAGGNQYCAYMYLLNTQSPGDGVEFGSMDDIPCETARTDGNLLQYVRAYACGMKPR
ncbi:unnamed protein product [Caenorhabditis angaria]|uniref:C-type lectin domain-containing protein n=1 Tax=Caenorhabditis angaria TaxID=860376 RepID=A0A9P1MV87_9PELO|nr:unnamed protein product [Caenorhabditis angaria]